MIDIGSGTASEISSLAPYTNVTALAIDREGTGIAWSKASGWLIEIDMADGSTTSIGHLPGAFEAFDHAPDGTLYGSSYITLYTIDPDERISSAVGNFSVAESMYSLTVVPEPTTAALLALGALWLCRRRVQAHI